MADDNRPSIASRLAKGWREQFAKHGLIFIGLFSLATLFVLSVLWSTDAPYQDEAAIRAGNHSAYASQKVEQDCPGNSPSARLLNCYDDIEHSEREYDRRELEISSQRAATWWTKITALAAVAGVIFSFAGMYLVWITFRETQKANEIAKSVQRPWISMSCTANSMAIDDKGIKVSYTVHFENIGTMVALGFSERVMHDVHTRRSFSDATRRFWRDGKEPEEVQRYVLLPGEIRDVEMELRREWSKTRFKDANDEDIYVIVGGYAWYQFDGSGIWHKTERSFTIGFRSENWLSERAVKRNIIRTGTAEDIIAKPSMAGKTT